MVETLSKNDRIEMMLRQPIWAVVGASDRSDKYGYKIYQFLRQHGYKVYPVNPNLREIAGEKCYPSLSSLPEKPLAVDMVISPRLSAAVLRECEKLDIKNVWFQPGTESDDIIALCQDLNLTVVYNACVMVEIRKRKG